MAGWCVFSEVCRHFHLFSLPPCQRPVLTLSDKTEQSQDGSHCERTWVAVHRVSQDDESIEFARIIMVRQSDHGSDMDKEKGYLDLWTPAIFGDDLFVV